MFSKEDKLKFLEYLWEYETSIAIDYGLYNYEDKVFSRFCTNNNIQFKTSRNRIRSDNFFCFEAKKRKGENGPVDFAHHFFRHLRNSIAHAKIRKERHGRSYFVLEDFKPNGNITMYGKIQSDLLWNMVSSLKQTRQQ